MIDKSTNKIGAQLFPGSSILYHLIKRSSFKCLRIIFNAISLDMYMLLIQIKAMELLEVKQQTFDRQLFSFDSISLISFLNEIAEVQKSCEIQSVLFMND